MKVIQWLPSGALEIIRKSKRGGSFGVVVLTDREQKEIVQFLVPRRDDVVAEWLKAWRDKYEKSHGYNFIIDQILDDYRLHADTGKPLNEESGE